MLAKEEADKWLLCCIAVCISTVLCGCQSLPSVRSDVIGSGGEMTLKLVAEYKQNRLEDVSSDGRFVVFYQTSRPIRTYTYRPGAGVKSDQPHEYEDLLRVLELQSGREVARMRAEFFPSVVQFVPGTQEVFYKEPSREPNKPLPFKLWNYSTGKVEVCGGFDAGGFGYATFIDEHQVLATSYSLVKLKLPDCSKLLTAQADPSSPKYFPHSRPILLPGGSHLAYALGPKDVVIRDKNTLEVIKLVTPPQGLFFYDDVIIYTPDGKVLLIAASTMLGDTTNSKQYLLFYNTKTYELARQLDISPNKPTGANSGRANESIVFSNAIHKMAVSTDSRILAIGRRSRDERQAFVLLFELETGKELAITSHAPVKPQRSDPFSARINHLAFTSDGKYLLSSTHETRVWRIERAGG